MARLTREQMEIYALESVELYRNLDTDIFRLITSILSGCDERSIKTWHVEALRQANMLNDSVTDMLATVTGRAHDDIERMIRTVGEDAVTQVDLELAPILGSIKRNSNTDRIIQAFTNQTFLDIDNFVNQTLITTHYGQGIVKQMYQGIINDITANFTLGNISIQKALERTILTWSDRGVSSIFIDRGGHTWSMERYVDMVLMSILNRTYNELRMSSMRDYGVHTAVVTTLPDAAPRCQETQGQVVDTRPIGQADSGYPSLYSFNYPAPDGPFGINCRHMLIPFIPGVNTNNQPQYSNPEMTEHSQARDRQRQLERRIRRSKKNIIILEELRSSRIGRMKETLLRQQEELRNHVNSYSGVLSRHRHRERLITPRADIIRDEMKS